MFELQKFLILKNNAVSEKKKERKKESKEERKCKVSLSFSPFPSPKKQK